MNACMHIVSKIKIIVRKASMKATTKNTGPPFSIFTAFNKMKEKKLKCVSMVLPCVLRNIRNIKISDEVIEKSSNEDIDEKGQLMLHAMKSVLEFLRPLVQEVNVNSSCSSKVSTWI